MSIADLYSKVTSDYKKVVVEFWRKNPDCSFDDAAKHGEAVMRENQKSGCYGILGWLVITALITSTYLNLKKIFSPDDLPNEDYMMGLQNEAKEESS